MIYGSCCDFAFVHRVIDVTYLFLTLSDLSQDIAVGLTSLVAWVAIWTDYYTLLV